MPADNRIEEVKSTLDAINADDATEDTAYEKRIAELEDEIARLQEFIAVKLEDLDTAAGAVIDAVAKLETRVAQLEAR